MKKRLVIYSGTALVMLAAWYALLFVPFSKDHQEINTRIQQAQARLDEYHRIMEQLPKYLDTYKNLKRSMSKLNEGLYAKDQILDLFDLLHKQAAKHGLKIVEITPPIEELLLLNSIMPGSQKPPFLNLGVKLQGSFADFGRYVRFIENADFYQGINRCQVTKSEDDNSPINHLIAFRALIGYSEEES